MSSFVSFSSLCDIYISVSDCGTLPFCVGLWNLACQIIDLVLFLFHLLCSQSFCCFQLTNLACDILVIVLFVSHLLCAKPFCSLRLWNFACEILCLVMFLLDLLCAISLCGLRLKFACEIDFELVFFLFHLLYATFFCCCWLLNLACGMSWKCLCCFLLFHLSFLMCRECFSFLMSQKLLYCFLLFHILFLFGFILRMYVFVLSCIVKSSLSYVSQMSLISVTFIRLTVLIYCLLL